MKIWNQAKQAFILFRRWKYNHYAILFLLFFVWISFLSPNNIGTQYKLVQERNKLRDLKQFYEEEIRKDEKEIRKFRTDIHFVETYGREQYLMKKDNEDIFLIVE